MAAVNGRTLDLDALYGPPMEIVFRGKTHVIPPEAFTMDLVMEIQKVMQDGSEAEEEEDGLRFVNDLQEIVGRFLSQAKPRLNLGPLPPAVLTEVASQITVHAFGAAADAVPPTPNRAARRAKATTGTRPTKR